MPELEGRRPGGHDNPTNPKTGHKVTLLKQQIDAGAYRVDARAVAGEMIAKMRLLSLSRRALLGRRSVGRGDPGNQARN